jgi:hypothetical protein
LGGFLKAVAFLVALALAGAPVSACAPPFGRTLGLRLRGLRFGLCGVAQMLDALPDPGSGRGAVLELFDRGDTKQLAGVS